MNTPLPDDLPTLAALHALGLLEEPEQSAFESQARTDGAAQALAAKHGQTAAALLEAASPMPPPPALRERLLARLPGAAQPAQSAEMVLEPGILLVRSQQKPWEETGIPGIRRKRLHFDPERKFASNLVSMAAGSVYPRHWHADLEELYMLAGQVILHGHTLGVGDYCRAEPGTIHAPAVAVSDCVFIAFASTKNQTLSPASFAVWLAHRLTRWGRRAG